VLREQSRLGAGARRGERKGGAVRRERPGTGAAAGFDGVGGEPVPIEVRGLHKRYGAKEAVAGVDLTIDPGTFLVLLGPSGSGKSTLVRCLAGIERVSAGRISFGGAEVDGPDRYLPPERRDLAMVFQDFALWPHLTAEDNVAFALKRRRLPSATRRAVARDALRRVGLADLHQRYPGQLSGGEQQRVALARALVARPGLLLFDEPLSNLDADRRERLRVDIGTMVREQGATAVYITHDQAEAFALADTVGVLSAGRLVQLQATGTPPPATGSSGGGITGVLVTLSKFSVPVSVTVPPSSEIATPTTSAG
jgi:ABC-type Fe3+/spermidine/putrescine transport system ATPase subunit